MHSEELQIQEVYLAAVQQDGWALQYVPKELQIQELCLASVQRDGW